MNLHLSWLLVLLTAARLAAGAQEPSTHTLYQEAWYVEEGLRDPEKAVRLYEEIAAKSAGDKEIGLKALTRAAECYRKLGNSAEEARVWEMAWKDYKEQIEKSDEYQHEAIRVRAAIDKALAGSEGIDLAEAFKKILDQMPPQQLRPMRDSSLLQAEQQRTKDGLSAIRSLKFAILLSTKLSDELTAAKAQSMIGEIQFEQEDYFGAIEAFGEARKNYPNQHTVLAWNQMRTAEAYRMSDMTDMALTTYDELIRAYPEQVEQVLWAKLWEGDCYRELVQDQSARDIWKEVAESKDAGKFPRPVRIGRMLAGMEKPAEPDAADKDAFTNDEFYFIAVKYQVDGDVQKAVQYWKHVTEISENSDWPCALARQSLFLHDASMKSGRE